MPTRVLLVALGILGAALAMNTAAAQPRPRESHDCCSTSYDFVRVPDGPRLRTIVTRPLQPSGRMPAVLFVGWLSCDSVELGSGPDDGWSRFQRALVRDAGAIVMRVDKPGVGDSDGVCAETDFETEVAGYRAALQALKRLDDVDTDALAIVGASMGGAIAPLLAQGERLKAIAVWGTYSGTWLEHMLEHERRRLTLAGDPPGLVNEKIQGLAALHTRMLIDRQSPREILAAEPRFRALWYGEPDGLYGRPATFFQQAQAVNLAAAWERVDAPVLAVHGEFDWIMSRGDHERIAAIVNKVRPGTARFVSVVGTDHHFLVYDSAVQAFREDGGRYNGEAAAAIVDFLRLRLFPEGDPRAGATGASTGPMENRDLFAPLVGDWDVDVIYHGPGSQRRARGTWKFAWALEGRAIQDVWRVATDSENPLGYGTTIRFYDPAIDGWHVTWHGVLNGTVLRFIARRQGTEIVMVEQGSDEPTRWIFSDISPAGFRWRAVTSRDNGRSWLTEQEMTAVRVRRREGQR